MQLSWEGSWLEKGYLPSFQRPPGWGCLAEEALAALSKARSQGGVSRDLWVDNRKGSYEGGPSRDQKDFT